MNRAPRKSAAQWATLVSEYDEGSESERDFCIRQGIKLVTFRKWRYHYQSRTQQNIPASASPFVKVNVQQPRATQQQAAVLCIGADIRLECPASLDICSLAQLALAVLHGR